MEENLHITRQTHQQQQRTNVSREKKMNTKENIERDQRKVQNAKHKNYCHTYSSACT